MKSVATIGVLMLAAGAHADTAFDNFGDGNTFNCCTGWTISGPTSLVGVDYDQGDQFVAEASGVISRMDVAMGWVTGTNDFFVDLHEDAGGQPGNIIASWQGGTMPQFGTVNNVPVEIINNDPDAVLVQGELYWLISSVPSDTWGAWNWNSIGDTGNHAFRQANGQWQVSGNTRGTFRIDVIIPAPGAAALLGLGGLVAAYRRR